MGRALAIYGSMLISLAVLWIGVAVYSVGGLEGLANMASRNPSYIAPDVAPPFREFKNRGTSFLWFGDSVSSFVHGGDPVDERTPCLWHLVRADLGGGRRRSGRARMFRTFQGAGFDGLHFLVYARYLARIDEYPDIAVVGVNMRSLNHLGITGFMRPFRKDVFAKRNGELSLGTYYRGLEGWTRAMVHGVFFVAPEPTKAAGRKVAGMAKAPGTASPGDLGDALPGTRTPLRRTSDERLGAEKGYQMVYGHGYVLNRGMLADLVHTGEVLRKGGCLVLYYITPYDGRQLRAREGNATADAMERAENEVVVALRSAGFNVLDEHALLKGSFAEPPSEHLAAAGRIKLAGVLVPWIRNLEAERTKGRRR